MKFILLKSKTFPNGYPWKINQIIDNTYYLSNLYGGMQQIIYNDEEIIEAKDWQSLNWRKILINEKSKYGYISPDGEWLGCNFECHQDVADFIIQLSLPEDHGWIKVFKGSIADPQYYTRRTFITDAQRKTLLDRNIELMPKDE